MTLIPGRLYVVATPIGNMDDISPRAVRTLREADLVLVEDTRRTGKLFQRLGISRPMLPLHDHNEAQRSERVLEILKSGRNVALVSDAGTPAVSDPGFRLLRLLKSENIGFIPIPGPCAATAALSVSGLPSDRFTFLGFAPEGAGKRRKWLEEAAGRAETVIFYTAPHDAAAFLAVAAEIMGPREAMLAREMTKLFEELIYGSLDELARRLAAAPPKGEITVVVKGREETTAVDMVEVEQYVIRRMEEGVRGRTLVEELRERFGLSKSAAYRAAHGGATGDDE